MENFGMKLIAAAVCGVIAVGGLLFVALNNDKRASEEPSIRPSNTFKVYSGTAGTYYVEQVRVKDDTIYVLTQNGRVIGVIPKDFQFK
jgi:hypothetical protein